MEAESETSSASENNAGVFSTGDAQGDIRTVKDTLRTRQAYIEAASQGRVVRYGNQTGSQPPRRHAHRRWRAPAPCQWHIL